MPKSESVKRQPEVLDTAVSASSRVELQPEVEKIINNLNPKERGIITRVIKEVQAESYSGPIPHPKILQGYNDVQPDFPERIVSMAEKEQDHRLECEKLMVEGTISETKRGQWFAFAIAFLFLAGSIWLGLEGHDWLAGVLGGSTLGVLVTVFLVGKRGDKDKTKEV